MSPFGWKARIEPNTHAGTGTGFKDSSYLFFPETKQKITMLCLTTIENIRS